MLESETTADTQSETGPLLFPIVGVGASAGGLEAFQELLRHLPLDTGMGFVLVQHLDPLHDSALTKLLSRATTMPVCEATDELPVQPNHIYVIPPNTSLSIAAGILKLQPREASRSPHRSIDFFLESLAQDRRVRAIGVILSGTATDGTLGLEAIKAEGGITFAQDNSAKYDSMPRSAEAAGCVDFVLSPEAIAGELARLAKHPYVAGAVLTSAQTGPEADHTDAVAHQDDSAALPSGGSGTPDNGAQRARAQADGAPTAIENNLENDDDKAFRRVLIVLRKHCGVDFALYKSNTIQRRIARRMLICHIHTTADYAKFLSGNTKELDALFSDVLISVTSFFRNPDAFEVLKHEVLPKLLAQDGDEPLRVWVLGCSTGQEAYSIAMAFVEAAEQMPRARKLQMFATDLNEALLDKARQGLYAKTLAADLSPERLRRFFVEENGGYRVIKPLREMVVFARQNLINDPPFSRIDIITCRNLLIYLEPRVQKAIFPMFHYALRPNGFLWLGASESVGSFTELFAPLDRKQKIYTRKAASTAAYAKQIDKRHSEREMAEPELRVGVGAPGPTTPAGLEDMHGEQSAQREADRIIVNQFAPPSVVIDARRQILQFRGTTSAYLQPPTGAASFDVLKMAREGLMMPLRSAIREAGKEHRAARRENLRIERDGAQCSVNVSVVPLKYQPEQTFLIVFEDADRPAPLAPIASATENGTPATARLSRALRNADKERIGELERNLSEMREYLQAIQESHEASSEELQAANEEVQSANEELQSLNEELSTSKEELESSNEELSTVNQELDNRNAELSATGSDLVNIQTSAHQVMLLLGRDLRVRRFSAQAARQFGLLVSDIGRPLGHIQHRLQIADLEALLTQVIDTMIVAEREVQDRDGQWFLLRVRPYVTLDNKVDGAVLVLVDIDTLKRNERALFELDAQYRAVFASTKVGICELDPVTGQLIRVNEGFAHITGYSNAELIGRNLLELMHPDDRVKHRSEIARLLGGEVLFHESEQRLLRRDAVTMWVHVTLNLITDGTGKPLRSVAIVLDITERLAGQNVLRETERRFRAMINALPAPIYATDAQGLLTHFNQAAADGAGRPPELGADHSNLGWKLYRPDGSTLLARDDSPIAVALASGRSVLNMQVIAERPEGMRRWYANYATPLHNADGQLIGSINMMVDISASKHDEARLHEADRQKTLILAMVAHEMRNPLAPIRNGLQILRRMVIADDPNAPQTATPGKDTRQPDADHAPKLESIFQMIERQVAQMVRLVDDLLDLNRVNLGKIDLRLDQVSLAAVMHQVEQESRPLCEGKGQTLSIALPSEALTLRADPARLVQIFGNLVSNASKFTARGGRITLAAFVEQDNSATLEPGQKSARQVVIRVTDNGIGIASADLPRLFQMFMQVDSSLQASLGGLGIGLALVKDLVALHGGTVAVRSEGIGRGSEFEVRLPIAPESKAGEATVRDSSVDTARTRSQRILVVDDNRDAANSIAMILKADGHEVHLAYDGLTAEAAAARLQPEVVLLDIGLPGIDGCEVARRIRAQSGASRVLLIAVTGWGQLEDRQRTERAGFDVHLVKPVDIDALLKLLAD